MNLAKEGTAPPPTMTTGEGVGLDEESQFRPESEQSPAQSTNQEENGLADEDEEVGNAGEDTEDEGHGLPLPLFG